MYFGRLGLIFSKFGLGSDVNLLGAAAGGLLTPTMRFNLKTNTQLLAVLEDF